MTHPVGNMSPEQLTEVKLVEDEFIVGAYGYLSTKTKQGNKQPILMGMGFIAAKLIN